MLPPPPIHTYLLLQQSKNYGFVEFATRAQAEEAKRQLAAKIISERAIRIDWMEGDASSLASLHSCTLFIDKLPRKLLSIDNIIFRCNAIAPVKFHRIALSHGNSRGFGFIDFATAADAARVQRALNNTVIDNINVRLSFGNPCKSGEQILGGPPPQPKKKAPRSRNNSTSSSGSDKSDQPDEPSARVPYHYVATHNDNVNMLTMNSMANRAPTVATNNMINNSNNMAGPYPPYYPPAQQPFAQPPFYAHQRFHRPQQPQPQPVAKKKVKKKEGEKAHH